MTREERELSITYLEGIKEKYIEGDGYERYPLPEYYAIEMAIKALDQRWIPVTERLPEEPYGCLVTIEDEEPMTGQMFECILPYFVGWDGERWNDSDGEQCPLEVIAWMPLPEPYKAESEDNECR